MKNILTILAGIAVLAVVGHADHTTPARATEPQAEALPAPTRTPENALPKTATTTYTALQPALGANGPRTDGSQAACRPRLSTADEPLDDPCFTCLRECLREFSRCRRGCGGSPICLDECVTEEIACERSCEASVCFVRGRAGKGIGI